MPAGYTYTFDAENHIIKASGMSGGPWYYVYDGLGLRVAKCSSPSHADCTTGPTGGTLYWRSISGDSLAETDLSGSTSNAAASEYVFFAGRRIAIRNGGTGAVNYIYADQLGSTVSMTDASGGACYTASFTPYGEEHPSKTSTCANTNNYKFTGYERDPETDLDYAFFRYYNYRLARFMSPDPLAGSVLDPQSLNRYAYVGNNPTNFTDPVGLFKHACRPDQLNCWGDLFGSGGGFDVTGAGFWGICDGSYSPGDGGFIQDLINGTFGTYVATGGEFLGCVEGNCFYAPVVFEQQGNVAQLNSSGGGSGSGSGTVTCVGTAKFSAVGPNQANAGALTNYGVPGHAEQGFAFSPAAFGLPYNTIPERVGSQRDIAVAYLDGQFSVSAEGLNLYGGASPPYNVPDVGDKNIRITATW